MSRKQKRMGPVGCFGQIENIKRQSLSTEPKLFNTIPTQFLLSHFYPHWFSTEPSFPAFSRLFFSSSTESADNLTEVILHQQTPAKRFSWFLFDKTVMPKIPNPSFLSGRARICACAIEERTSMRRSLSLDWYPARKETIAGLTLPVPH